MLSTSQRKVIFGQCNTCSLEISLLLAARNFCNICFDTFKTFPDKEDYLCYECIKAHKQLDHSSLDIK